MTLYSVMFSCFVWSYSWDAGHCDVYIGSTTGCYNGDWDVLLGKRLEDYVMKTCFKVGQKKSPMDCSFCLFLQVLFF